ncbi:putative RNA-binding protein [Neofusicoccum parvum]|nr:putative rna recognition domain-containing protein [Neofusicoccum parvum UCRNP2]GME27130.1 putative RNA-binding protein [Neofusicoccum parvum]GME38346.1 putative RNA-binding protein [Neofusicoccum parvum]
MDYETEPRPYDDEPRDYERDRSRSPRNDRRVDDDARARSASPGARDRLDDRPANEPMRDRDDESINPGSNLFVTGIHPRLSEEEVTRLFEKYGDVEKCNIMRDPHTKESRGFGFVKMVTPDQADAAKEGLQGEVIEGRTLSIEKARRSRPRTPTPGKYYGPPKREDFRGGRGGRFYGDRYDDRRGYGGGRRGEDYGSRGPRYDSYDRGYGGGGGDRGYDRGDRGYSRRDRDYGPPRGVDRYASGRDDRYASGGGGGRYGSSRDDRYGREGGASYGAAPADEPYAGGRAYDDRGDDYYSRH